MRIRKKFIRALILLGALIPFIRTPTNAFADGDVSTLTYTAEVQGTAIDGAEITLYKIADIYKDSSGNESYILSDPYKSILENVSEEDMEKNTREYARKVSEAAAYPYKTLTTDKTGSAVFSSLPEGVYLAKETGKKDTAKNYSDFEPSILRIPEIENGTVSTDIHAELKIAPEKTGTPVPTKIPVKKTTVVPTKIPVRREDGSDAIPKKTQDTSPSKTSFLHTVPVKTGDETEAGMFFGGMIAAISFLFLLASRKEKKK